MSFQQRDSSVWMVDRLLFWFSKDS